MDDVFLAFALILVGFLLMAAELVIFTHGVLSMLGLGGMIVGVVLLYGRDSTLGIATLVVLLVVVPLCGRALIGYWPNTSIGRQLLLQPPREQTTIADTPGSKALDQLLGRVGKTLSPLRPSGVVDFDGRRVDAMSEGMLVEAGQWVRCIDVHASKVVVRVTDAPGPANLEEMKL